MGLGRFLVTDSVTAMFGVLCSAQMSENPYWQTVRDVTRVDEPSEVEAVDGLPNSFFRRDDFYWGEDVLRM